MSQMLFVDVVVLLPATHPVVVLQEADPPYRELRIPVGGAEGIAIGYAARGLETPRPLTHELLARILEEVGMTLDVVRITTVRGTAFTAEMVISGRLGARVIDCRPSDAIALALRHRLPVPIMAAPSVLVRAGSDPTGSN
jgi:bifunctional DNase/RNase